MRGALFRDAFRTIERDSSPVKAAAEDLKNTAELSAVITSELERELLSDKASKSVAAQLQSIKIYSPKIIGGNPVAYRQYPWQVALLQNMPPFRQFCGGSLIRKNWILTAAHCVDGGTLPSDVLVLVGTDFLDQPGKRIRVRMIHKHENYIDPTLGFDIALLELQEPAEETTIDLISSANENALTFPGVFAWVTGWGITETGYPSIQLRDVDVRRISNDECTSPQMYNGSITDTMICAGYRIGKKDSCQGDSGGPLIASNQKGGFLQFGVVSWGEGCAQENRPGVYTRIAAFDAWLTSKLPSI